MEKIRKGDKVVVIAGKHKGTSGEVLRVIPAKDRVLVSGVNVVTNGFEHTQRFDVPGTSAVELSRELAPSRDRRRRGAPRCSP